MQILKVKNVINKNLIFLIIVGNSLVSLSQEKITGEYLHRDGTGEFYTNYIFKKKGIFTYKSGGDIGVSAFGKGHYFIKRDSLFLNYDLTELKENSYHRQKVYKNFKDSIVVKINIYDVDKNPLSDILVDNDITDQEKTSQKNGIILFKLKNQKGKAQINISNFWYGLFTFSINTRLNHEIYIYLKKRNGIAIKNVIYKYKILEFDKEYIKLKNKKRIVIWKKIE